MAMHVLVLGGTQFVGRAIVQRLLADGHQVSLLHRGKTNPGLFPEARHLIGDRNDIGSLVDAHYDAVIDVSAYTPDQVETACAALSGKCDQYVFISTVSVYDTAGAPVPFDEATPLLPAWTRAADAITAENYGPLKVACEQQLAKLWPGKRLILRPGIIFGPHDHTGRFPYWVERFVHHNQVLVPSALEQAVQWVDADDLADFAVRGAAEGGTGIYNILGPSTTMGGLLDEVRSQVGTEHRIVSASLDDLAEMGVRSWADLPLFVSGEKADRTFQFSGDRAKANGLRVTPISETVRKVIHHVRSSGHGRGKYGMDRSKEVQIIESLLAAAPSTK